MPQLDIFTIFIEVFQFSFIFWLLYIYLISKILPLLYKTIKVRNDKIVSLNKFINVKLPKIITLNKKEFTNIFNFYLTLNSTLYLKYVKILYLYNAALFNFIFKFFILNYKVLELNSQSISKKLINYNFKLKGIVKLLN